MNERITALNTDTEMVLIALGADSETLALVAWARAAYIVQLPPQANDTDALRSSLQEVLNHGRDTALVVSLDDLELNAEAVHGMVSAYCSAGDEIWAVATESAMQEGHPVLMGRPMIEVFLRGKSWSTASEVLSANSKHVSALNVADSTASMTPAPPSI